jgi:hypothetical protein
MIRRFRSFAIFFFLGTLGASGALAQQPSGNSTGHANGGSPHTFSFTSSANTHCVASTGGSTETGCTLGVAPGAGTIVFVTAVTSGASTTGTPAANDHGSCNATLVSPDGKSTTNDGTAGTAWLFCYVPSGACGASWHFVTGGGTGFIGIIVNIVTYTPTSPLVAQDGSDVIDSGTSGTSINTPSVPSSSSGDLQFCYAASESGISGANSPWTSTGAGSAGGDWAELILSSSSSQSCNFTQTSGHWDSIGATFK